MNTVSLSKHFKTNYAAYLLDGLALALVYSIPTLSHLMGVPFYLFEPMRIFIILALVHSNKTNAYVLALTLPVFSFLLAAHPVFLKSIIMTIELTFNVFLFYYLIGKKVAGYQAVLLSVVGSKLLYYLLKFVLIQLAFLNMGLISTPIYIQLISTLIFGVYGYFILRK